MTSEPKSEIIALATQGPETDITLTRQLPVKPARAYDACLDAKTIGEWWGPNGFTTVTHRMERREGGSWRHTMIGPDGQEQENLVTYLKLERPHRIEYEIRPAPDGPLHFHATLIFESEGGGTRTTFNCRFLSRQARDEAAEFGAAVGLKQHLDRFLSYLVETEE